MQCKYQQGQDSRTTLYTHIQNVEWHRQEKRSYAGRTRGEISTNFQKVTALCSVNTSRVQTHRPHCTHI